MNVFEVVATAVASFLGGSMLTVFAFVLPFSGRLTKIETEITGIQKQLSSNPVCSLHTTIATDLAQMKNQVEVNSKRLDTIEAN